MPLVWTGPGQAFSEHCRKDVHDLRGQGLIQIAQFMQTHKGACSMMGPAARSDEP